MLPHAAVARAPVLLLPHAWPVARMCWMASAAMLVLLVLPLSSQHFAALVCCPAPKAPTPTPPPGQAILVDTGIDNKRTKDLSEEELTRLREEVDKYTTEVGRRGEFRGQGLLAGWPAAAAAVA